MGVIQRALAPFMPQSYRSANDPTPVLSIDELSQLFSFNGNQYLTGAFQQTLRGHVEEIDASFVGLVAQAYRTNAVVFACELARIQLFSEARFQFQRMRNGRPGELFGDPSLGILEHPWPTAITGDLLVRALLDADLGGTAFLAKRGRTAIRRLRPDWVTMVLGSETDDDVEAGDIDADVLGLMYHPGGRGGGRPPEFLLRSEISIFVPNPDPLGQFRGMPWVLPVIREIMADKQMTDHKSAFLVNGATPNLTVAVDKDLKEAANPAAFNEWVEAFKKTNPTGGQWNKFKTWYLAGGTIVTKVGSNMQEIDFKQVQGAGETRIAAAAGVPPVIVGLSEGLQAATYSNYGQARRRFADNTMRPLWRNMAGSLETIVPPPSGSRLWYDDRDIQALAEDKKDLAEVNTLKMQQLETGIRAGFKANAVIAAVEAGDVTLLKDEHTGLFSVQLQAPGSTKMPGGEAPGEGPVGPGTGPEKPSGPAPAAAKRDELLGDLLRYAMTRPQPDTRLSIEPGAIVVNTPDIHPAEVRFDAGAIVVNTPDIHVDAATTIAEGAVVVNTPEVRNDITVEPTPIEVTVAVEPTPIEVRNDVTVEPTPITVQVEAPDETPMRTVIDYAPDGVTVIGDHEERME